MSQLGLRRGVLALGLLAVLAFEARAQEFSLPTAQQFQGLQQTGVTAADNATVQVKAVFTAPAQGQSGRLYILADIKQGWHIYSITQAKGGPVPTKIKLTTSPGYRLTGEFKAVPPPAVHMYPEAYKDLPVEEHAGRVVWHAPLEVSPNVDPRSLKIEGKLNVQACDETNCWPPHDYPFTALLGTAPKLPADPNASTSDTSQDNAGSKSATYENPRSHSKISGHISASTVAAGQTVQLNLTATPAEQWHVYAAAEKADATGSKPTLIVLTDLPAGWRASAPRASSQAITKKDGPAGFNQPFHEGPVTWTIDLSVPADTQPGEHRLAGLMGFQTCWPNGCDLPLATRFEATLRVGPQAVEGTTPLHFADARYAEAARLAAERTSATDLPHDNSPAGTAFDPTQLRANTAGDSASASLPLMMLFGFLGGLILNLMPCVLPVIGLKILSFVEQSGQDRRQVLWLNIWYSLGLMSVFMVLASLAAFLGFGWGQQFASSTFNIVLVSIVFAMALSFLGVWEIPIPGFVGTGKASELATKEGVTGAFAKGMITTVLATPCTGPFLGTSLAWAVRQPPYLTFLLFGCVGLGMASPYLLLGAFPALVRYLPRPGAWMETFKQLMGFVLLGTVVFLLTFIEWTLIVPTVALMFGIWLACWWVGRTPYTADFGVKARAWMAAATLVGLSSLIAYNWLSPVMEERFAAKVDRAIGDRMSGQASLAPAAHAGDGHRLPWQPFTRQTLTDLTSQQKTVMVDFTADWCLVCKTLEKVVLNTEPVRGVVDAKGVVPLMADWTNGDADVTAMLELLGSKQVPVLAIFPAGRPNEPIVFRDPYSRQQLIEALEKAGPSRSATGDATAMRLDAPR